MHGGREANAIAGRVAEGSPISVSGYVTYGYDESKVSYRGNISAKNVSDKSVLLMVMHLEAGGAPRLDETFSQEYFFGDALEPGASEVQDGLGASLARAVNGVPQIGGEHAPEAVAKVRVEFVQFGDGSSWGDADSAKTVLGMRRETLGELDKLEHIYEQAGEDAFLEELARADDPLPVISQLKGGCRDRPRSPNCAHDAVRRTIEVAKEHQAGMDSGAAPQASAPR
jgi:hypothetical protein